jgi:hypothetical protein
LNEISDKVRNLVSAKIDIDLIKYFYLNMYQQVEEDELINGENYYVKRKKRKNNMNIKNFHGMFNGSDFEGFVWFKIYNEFNEPIDSIELDTELNTFYRYVSKEEYYAKVKEKYDAKCLNIILKRLVDESFQWN